MFAKTATDSASDSGARVGGASGCALTPRLFALSRSPSGVPHSDPEAPQPLSVDINKLCQTKVFNRRNIKFMIAGDCFEFMVSFRNEFSPELKSKYFMMNIAGRNLNPTTKMLIPPVIHMYDACSFEWFRIIPLIIQNRQYPNSQINFYCFYTWPIHSRRPLHRPRQQVDSTAVQYTFVLGSYFIKKCFKLPEGFKRSYMKTFVSCSSKGHDLKSDLSKDLSISSSDNQRVERKANPYDDDYEAILRQFDETTLALKSAMSKFETCMDVFVHDNEEEKQNPDASMDKTPYNNGTPVDDFDEVILQFDKGRKELEAADASLNEAFASICQKFRQPNSRNRKSHFWRPRNTRPHRKR
uniref:MSP domain-containing protein n=1 Tax=Panagrellus redivivus TaxID=6233 RepID=A0A7E4WB68_PANRE